MGLDITAYRQVTLIDATCTDVEEYEEKYPCDAELSLPYINDQGFPGRAAPIVPGVYRHAELFAFRAGSYSGYNLWRTQLAEMATGRSPRTIWGNCDDPAVRALPFYLLINFSDCEGVIGTDAAKALAQEFATWQAKANQHPDEWFRMRYASWRRACDMAADGGYIQFH